MAVAGKEPVLQSKRTQVGLAGVVTALVPVLMEYLQTGVVTLDTVQTAVSIISGLVALWIWTRTQRNTAV